MQSRINAETPVTLGENADTSIIGFSCPLVTIPLCKGKPRGIILDGEEFFGVLKIRVVRLRFNELGYLIRVHIVGISHFVVT